MPMMKYLPFVLASSVVLLTACDDNNNDDKNTSYDFSSSSRSETSIVDNWRFQMNYADDVSIDDEFDDSGWETVNLPHVWDLDDGQNGGDYFYGESTYRKTLNIEKLEADKRYYLEFEGASQIAEVYVNEVKVGKHIGGFSTFRMDVTQQLKEGGNQIVVQVDNRLSADNTQDNFGRDVFLPLDNGADFTWWGGLYRDVNLLELSDVSIDAEDFGGPGLYISQDNVSAERADLHLAIHLANKSEQSFSGQVLVTIQDADENTVQTKSLEVSVADGGKLIVEDDLVMENPVLWQGRKNPYLYSVYAQVIKDGKVLDQVKQPLGLRTMSFDPDRGFFLNGESYPLRGVAMHQDYLDSGWATTQEQRYRSLDLAYEMGANTIRLSHYPHSQDTMEYSNKLGLINWVEIPLINGVSLDPTYLSSAKAQTAEMIKQNYNHPSVGVWGVANEVSAGNTVPGETDAGGEKTAAVLKQISDYVHELDVDPYRLTTLSLMQSDNNQSSLRSSVDITSWNRYEGWYSGLMSDFGEFMDSFHEDNPDIVTGTSEYGVGASPFIHTDEPIAQDHSEEFAAIYHESYLAQIEERPYLWATHVWNMFDFAVTWRNEGDTKGRNDKGMVTYDRDIKKDSFFLYQAAWSKKPMVHISSKRKEESTRSYIKAYSNLDELRLVIDGQEKGTLYADDNSNRVVFEWDNLNLSPGTYQVEVIGESQGEIVRDSFEFTRISSESNTLSSALISIAVMDDEENQIYTGIISNIPHGATVEELKGVMQIPSGSIVQLVDKNTEVGTVEVGDDVTVISESGVKRDYTVVADSSISLLRPVTDTGFNLPISGGNRLTDNNPDTMWAAMYFAPLDIDINLQQVYYIDKVVMKRGDSSTDHPGTTTFDIGTHTVVVDYEKVLSVTDWEPTEAPFEEAFTIGAVDKNVMLKVANVHNIPVSFTTNKMNIMLADLSVYGGMIYSSGVAFDYENHTITLGGISSEVGLLAELQKASTNVNISVEAVDNDALQAGDKVIATRIVQGLTFREEYTLQ
ncbi:sugar-binding domain-containing protein [Vibrio litoralis]|uniref:sugar-binding domain-containing protein n=1 Tax=Vibrio litoralis TaxID=335972 RepID=UPI000A01049B